MLSQAHTLRFFNMLAATVQWCKETVCFGEENVPPCSF